MKKYGSGGAIKYLLSPKARLLRALASEKRFSAFYSQFNSLASRSEIHRPIYRDRCRCSGRRKNYLLQPKFSTADQNQVSFSTDWILIFHFRRHTVADFSFKFGGKLFMCSCLLKSKNLFKTIQEISLLELLWNQSLRGISLTHYLPPGGYSWEFLVWVCRPVLQILTLFQTKKN